MYQLPGRRVFAPVCGKHAVRTIFAVLIVLHLCGSLPCTSSGAPTVTLTGIRTGKPASTAGSRLFKPFKRAAVMVAVDICFMHTTHCLNYVVWHIRGNCKASLFAYVFFVGSSGQLIKRSCGRQCSRQTYKRQRHTTSSRYHSEFKPVCSLSLAHDLF